MINIEIYRDNTVILQGEPRELIDLCLTNGYSQAVDSSNKLVHDIFLDINEQDRIASDNGFSSRHKYARYTELKSSLPIYC